MHVGLMLNEVIINAIKHAFDGSENEVIAISILHMDNKNLLLTIRYTDKGLPQDFDLGGNNSPDMCLVL